MTTAGSEISEDSELAATPTLSPSRRSRADESRIWSSSASLAKQHALERAALGWSVARLSVSVALDDRPSNSLKGLATRVRQVVACEMGYSGSGQTALPLVHLEARSAVTGILGRALRSLDAKYVHRSTSAAIVQWRQWTQYRIDLARRWNHRHISLFESVDEERVARKGAFLAVRSRQGSFAAAAQFNRARVCRTALEAWLELVVLAAGGDEVILM